MTKIERCQTGTILLLLVAKIFDISELPKAANLKAKSEFDSHQNMGVLKKILSDHNHSIKFDLEKVVKGKVPEIVELVKQIKKVSEI